MSRLKLKRLARKMAVMLLLAVALPAYSACISYLPSPNHTITFTGSMITTVNGIAQPAAASPDKSHNPIIFASASPLGADIFKECNGVFPSTTISFTKANRYENAVWTGQSSNGVITATKTMVATGVPPGATSYVWVGGGTATYDIRTGYFTFQKNQHLSIMSIGPLGPVRTGIKTTGNVSGTWPILTACDTKNLNTKGGATSGNSDQEAPGICPLQNTASRDPVDLASGYYYDTLKLIEVNAPGVPLQFGLSYNSGSLGDGIVGVGWRHSYQFKLDDLVSSVLVAWPDGHVSSYQRNVGGIYTVNGFIPAAEGLFKNANLTYTLTDRKQQTYIFDSTGNLIRTIDRNGFVKNFAYLAGKLDRVTDALSGRFLQFTYDINTGNVASVASSDGEVVSLTYDLPTGDLLLVNDVLGGTTSFTYDTNHRLLTKMNPLGGGVTNTYDPATSKVSTQDDGLLTTPLESFAYATDAVTGGTSMSYGNRNGSTNSYNFDASCHLVSQTDPHSGRESRLFDPATGQQTSYTDPLNNQTRFTYDSAGYILSRTDATGKIASNTYDAAHNIVSSTDEAGNVTSMTYGLNHQMLSRTEPSGKVTTYTYNAQGLLATMTVPNGGVTSYTYDLQGNLVSKLAPSGLTTTYTYDAAGRVLTASQGVGKVWAWTYDLKGNVLTETNPVGAVTAYTYDVLGRMDSKTMPNAGIIGYFYDANNNLISVIDPLGGFSDYAYDADDKLISITDPMGRVTTLTRDAKGRVTSTIKPLGNTRTLSYDAADNLISVRDALGNAQSMAYDSLRRLTSSTNVLGSIASQTFDVNGNRLSFTDTKGNVTSFTYDVVNRITRVTTADGGAVNYTYNTLDQVATATNARGQVASYTYDLAGRLTSMVDPAGTITLTYDANGNVLTVADATGTLSYSYDAVNRKISHTDAFGNVIAYAYDAAGNLTSLTYPGGKVVSYAYDLNNRMTTVTDWSGHITRYTYNANGEMTAIARANLTSAALGYDVNGQLTTLAETFPLVANNYSVVYAYDPNGNITSETMTPAPAAANVAAMAMTYGADNRLSIVNALPITFDADGNMTGGVLGGVAATFAYSARSHLTGVGTSSYIYNAMGNRISASNAAVVTRYVVDPNASLLRVLMETSSTGVPIAYYVYGASGLISREDAALAYRTYHYDLRGSTVKLADATGVVTDTYNYGVYGEALPSTGVTPNPFRYNARDGVMTEPNGLYYMRARYYLPELKRFVNRDVLLGDITDSLTLNRFAYVNGNPIGFVDPSGYFASTGRVYALPNENSTPPTTKTDPSCMAICYGRTWSRGDCEICGGVAGKDKDIAIRQKCESQCQVSANTPPLEFDQEKIRKNIERQLEMNLPKKPPPPRGDGGGVRG
ncbi:MAG: DUF6531 domain-containing protein [Gallionella sp.]|nr:DUF6531 domain-containing protein [Gallionella sp.]MDD4959914.1 DUF6531 domain-containing protein [Gallionella sp.]